MFLYECRLDHGEKNFHLTMAGRPAHQAGFNGAGQHGPQKDNVAIQKFFSLGFYYQECFAYTISELEFTVLTLGYQLGEVE